MLNRILFYLGWLFAALAMAGVALPLLPATPFALLAAACFARSSPEAYRRLFESPGLGPVLRDWEQHRGLSQLAKLFVFAAVLIAATFTTLFSTTGGILQIAAAISVAVTAIILLMIRTVRER